jgi:hypothetical protein
MSFVHALAVPTDEKAAPPSPPVLPPSYQAAEEAVSRSPTDPESDQPNRPRRRCRRLFPFLVIAFFVWLTGRHLLRHCRQRKFGPHDHDRVHWVS